MEFFDTDIDFDIDTDIDIDIDTDIDTDIDLLSYCLVVLLSCCLVDSLTLTPQAFRFTSHLTIILPPLQGSLTFDF